MNEPALTHEAQNEDSTAVFGFWMYLMSDFVLFAGLFATYAVFKGNVFGGPAAGDLFSMPYVLVETVLLLTSSFTCGLALLAAQRGSIKGVITALSGTFLLGVGFVWMEIAEFRDLILAGHGPDQSGFLSSYFTLVGTHGLHVAIGLLWLVALAVSILARGLGRSSMRKLALFSLFWHFLDIVWIFIFTIVYLMRFL